MMETAPLLSLREEFLRRAEDRKDQARRAIEWDLKLRRDKKDDEAEDKRESAPFLQHKGLPLGRPLCFGAVLDALFRACPWRRRQGWRLRWRSER